MVQEILDVPVAAGAAWNSCWQEGSGGFSHPWFARMLEYAFGQALLLVVNFIVKILSLLEGVYEWFSA